MARQILDIGTADNQPADTIRTGGGKINDNFEQLYRGYGSSTAVQYVDKAGSDSENGLTPQTAKLTVAAAIAALPQSSSRPYGRLRIGRGTFVETQVPMLVAGGLIVEGMGASTSGLLGTSIQLGDNENAHIFECTNLASQNHNLMFRDLKLDGNKANQSGTENTALIKLAGGYGVRLDNIALSNAGRWGIHVSGGYMNIQMLNITGSSCGSTTQGGFMFLDQTQSGGNFSLDGFQVDQCGVIPIFIQYGTDGDGHMFAFRNGKMENQTTAALHAKCIVYSPRLTGVGNSVFILVENCFFYNNAATTDQHPAPLYENNEAGLGARWIVLNCESGAQYVNGWESAKKGRTSESRSIRCLIEQDPDEVPPLLELGGIQHLVGNGVPGTASPNGSLYHRRDGSGTTDNLYIRRSGSWVGIA